MGPSETILTKIVIAIINSKRIGVARRTTLTSKRRFHLGTGIGGTGKSLNSDILFKYMAGKISKLVLGVSSESTKAINKLKYVYSYSSAFVGFFHFCKKPTMRPVKPEF
jgi:hypothetical protein